MRATPLLVVVLAAACAKPAAIPPRPLGVQDNLAEAERHDADADALEARAAAREQVAAPAQPAYVCGDQALADQATSGGERLGGRAPCWRGETNAVERDRAAAARLRADARAHRAQARALLRTSHAWCAGLPVAELDHTPFDHREDLQSVSAELEGDRIRGARIRFRPVPGLTAEWLRQTLACHQALAAAEGYDPHYLASCPAVIAGTTIDVIDDPDGLVVVIRGDDPAAALTAYGRAEALLDPHLDDEPGHVH